MPWEETDENVRSGHRSPDEFRQGSLRTIVLSEAEGIKAVIGKSKDREKTEVQSYLFDKSKGWAVDKAKAWFEQHHESEVVHERFSIVLPFGVMEKIANKPLLIHGVAMTAGVSRSFNIYTPEELQAFARKLLAAVTFVDGDFHGLRSNVWVCPRTVLAITESVVVRVYCRFGSGSWVIIGSGSAVFTTERLGASKLDGVAWTVYYVRSFTYDAARNRASISLHFDGSDNSRIVNFALSSAGVEGELRIMGDGLTWPVVSY